MTCWRSSRANLPAVLAISQNVVNAAFLVILVTMTGLGGLFGLYVIWRGKG